MMDDQRLVKHVADVQQALRHRIAILNQQRVVNSPVNPSPGDTEAHVSTPPRKVPPLRLDALAVEHGAATDSPSHQVTKPYPARGATTRASHQLSLTAPFFFTPTDRGSPAHFRGGSRCCPPPSPV
jgi:hypothetical protein